MKKSNKYLKLISCLVLCVVLMASVFLTACGEDSASGSGNIDISKLTKNKAESTTNIETEVPTEIPTEAEITEQVETTAETETPTEEEKPTEEPKDNTIKKYESNDITITPISQYEAKRQTGFFSSEVRNVIVTSFLVSGKGLQQVDASSINIITKTSVKSNESGGYDRCIHIGGAQYNEPIEEDSPYYAMGKYKLNSQSKEEPYILIIEMEKGLFELSDFKYIFKIGNDEFYKELSFNKGTTDVLKPYIKNNDISHGDVFVNNNELYYVDEIYSSGFGTMTEGSKVSTTTYVYMSLISLTNNKEVDISYNYNGKENFSKMEVHPDIKTKGCSIIYSFFCKLEGNVEKFNEKIMECYFKIKQSGVKIIPQK